MSKNPDQITSTADLLRGQCVVYLGGQKRLLWFKNETRRIFERLCGESMHWLNDQEEVKKRLGVDGGSNLVVAGMCWRDNPDPDATPDDLPGMQAKVDEWMDELLLPLDLMAADGKPNEDNLRLLRSGLAETLETINNKVSTAFGWSLAGGPTPDGLLTVDEDEEDVAGKEDAAA